MPERKSVCNIDLDTEPRSKKGHHGASGASTDPVPVYMLQDSVSLFSYMRVLPTRRQILEIQ